MNIFSNSAKKEREKEARKREKEEKERKKERELLEWMGQYRKGEGREKGREEIEKEARKKEREEEREREERKILYTKERKEFEKSLKGKILPYKTLEELCKDYRSIYSDIKNRFPDCNIEFIKDNISSKSLYNIDLRNLNYNNYIAYKLLKILRTSQQHHIKHGNYAFRYEDKITYIMSENYIAKQYTKYYETYEYDSIPFQLFKFNKINLSSYVASAHKKLIDNLLDLEKEITYFIKFVKDIDAKAFMDNVNLNVYFCCLYISIK